VKQDYDQLKKVKDTLVQEVRQKEQLIRRLLFELSKYKIDNTKNSKPNSSGHLPHHFTQPRIELEKEIEAAALTAIAEEEKLRKTLIDKEKENQQLIEGLRVHINQSSENNNSSTSPHISLKHIHSHYT
jgi:hypothetical protein